MISIDNKKLNDKDEDIILMALYHYNLVWMLDKYCKKKDVKLIVKRINKLIDRITKDFPDFD